MPFREFKEITLEYKNGPKSPEFYRREILNEPFPK